MSNHDIFYLLSLAPRTAFDYSVQSAAPSYSELNACSDWTVTQTVPQLMTDGLAARVLSPIY
jgi:hypothetical protein